MLRLQAFLCGSDVSSLAGCFFSVFAISRYQTISFRDIVTCWDFKGIMVSANHFCESDFVPFKFDPSHSLTHCFFISANAKTEVRNSTRLSVKSNALSLSLAFSHLPSFPCPSNGAVSYNNQNQLIYHSDSKSLKS